MDEIVDPELETGEEYPTTPVQHPFHLGVPETAPDGTGQQWFNEQEEAEQQPLLDTAKDTLDQSVANSLYEYAGDLGDAVGEFIETGSASLEPLREELTKDVPLHLHDNIMGSRTVTGAKARRDRILNDLTVQRRLAKQVGISATAVQFAAGLVDIDLPLMFATGGTLAGARTAASAARAARSLGASTALSRVAGEVAVGVTGGAIAGGIVGGVDAAIRDDRDIGGMIQTILAAATLGGVLTPAIGTVIKDKTLWTEAARQEYATALRTAETEINKALVDPDHAINKHTSVVEETTMDGFVMPLGDRSIGAAETGQTPKAVADDQLGLAADGAGPSVIELSTKMQQWKQDSNFEADFAADTANPLVKLLVGDASLPVRIPFTDTTVDLGQIAGTVFTLGQRDFTNLIRSQSPTANFVAVEILESASGLGRKGSTAAVLREMYHGSAMVHSAEALVNERGKFMREMGLNPLKVSSHQQFSRELRLAMHEYYTTGVLPTRFGDLITALDKTNRELLGHMKGLDENTSVRGARDIDQTPGYFRYDWEPKNFLKARQLVGEEKMVSAFTQAYMRGSGLDMKLAKHVAKAIVRRFSDRGRGINTADSRLLDLDSRTGIEEMLIQSGVKPAVVKRIMRNLDVNTQERGKKGYLKGRVEADLNVQIPGTDMKIVDLMSDDFEMSLLRYAGDASSAAALAAKGIRDKADVEKVIDTIMYEQSVKGENSFTRDHLEAIFSQFSGGAHKGYMFDTLNEGINPLTQMLTKATRISLLQRVGLTQVMDSANIVVANGLAGAMEPVMVKFGFAGQNAMSKAKLKTLHEEMTNLGVILGQDHMLFRPHLTINERDIPSNVYLQTAQAGLNSAERITNYASGQIHVTKAQQLVAGAATASNIIRTLALEPGATNLTPRKLRDLGLEPEIISELMTLIDTGVIKVEGGNVTLRSSLWPAKVRQEFGAAIYRAVNQQVQKGLIGETSVWMNSDLGKLLTSLKTFALVATQKQAARQLMIGGHPQLLQAAAWQLGFAYAIVTLAQGIQGREMSEFDRARLAVAYTPTLGVIPMTVDPLTSMLGFDSLNFSPYGRYSNYMDTPVFETVQKLMQSPGGIKNMLSGDGDYNDAQNARAMFLLNWYGMQRVWTELGEQ